jgi:pantetheine-phosphate adenylyltransferase
MKKEIKKPKKVVVGGTFDILHKGHKALFKKAFELGVVTIGLTSDVFAKKIKKRKVVGFNQRKMELENFIKKDFKLWPKILKIEDKFGPTLEEDFDYIIVSPKTYKTALLINKERQERNKKPIEIVKINFVLAEDRKSISSTRILKGEINEKGELLKKSRINSGIKL